MDMARWILEKKGVKAVTDMMYEARIAAVIRIEAAKKSSCPRTVALGPKAERHPHQRPDPHPRKPRAATRTDPPARIPIRIDSA